MKHHHHHHPGELQWKSQQKTLWAEVRRATGNGKNRVKIRDLLAGERCTRPILDFLHTTAGDPEQSRRNLGTKRQGRG